MYLDNGGVAFVRRRGRPRKKKLTKQEKLRILQGLLADDSSRQRRVKVSLARFSWDREETSVSK